MILSPPFPEGSRHRDLGRAVHERCGSPFCAGLLQMGLSALILSPIPEL